MFTETVYKLLVENNKVLYEKYINAHYDDEYRYNWKNSQQRFKEAQERYFSDDDLSESEK